MAADVRQVNVRMPADLLDRVEAIRQIEEATGDHVTTTDLFREALELLVETRRHDAEFQARRKTALDRARKLYESVK